MTTATLPSGTGIVSTYSYDDADRLTGITHVKSGSTTIASVADTLDDVGNRTSMTVAGNATTYAYDDNDRITSVTPPSPASVINYTWDDNGEGCQPPLPRPAFPPAGSTLCRQLPFSPQSPSSPPHSQAHGR